MAGVVFGDLSWEIDFFGRLRRAMEAAQAEFFASEENRKFIIQTLVSDLARAYINLRAFDQQLDISKRTVKVREESLQPGQVPLLLWLGFRDPRVDDGKPVIWGQGRGPRPAAGHRAAGKPDQHLAGAQPRTNVLRGKPLLKQNLTVTVPPG